MNFLCRRVERKTLGFRWAAGATTDRGGIRRFVERAELLLSFQNQAKASRPSRPLGARTIQCRILGHLQAIDDVPANCQP